MSLVVQQAGPASSVQDGGRPGQMGLGLSRGGAADRHGYLVACALMGVPPGAAAIEMAGVGGQFSFTRQTRFALAGAPMRAALNDVPLAWNSTHVAPEGARLNIGPAETGVYGYLLPAGGIAAEPELGGRGYHQIAGLGARLAEGDVLPLGPDPMPNAAPVTYDPGAAPTAPLRVMQGPQTGLFADREKARFESTVFRRSTRANRQGVRLEQDGQPFATGAQLSQVSDFICEGDIQMTGDGTPYVLLSDCQTMGGYPRIGTVVPVDLPRVAQAVPGEALSFRFVTLQEAEALWESDESILGKVAARIGPRLRDPREMTDLLTYEFIGKPVDD